MIKYPAYLLPLLLLHASCKKETPVEQSPPDPNPVIRILSPTSSTILQDSVYVQVEATDDKGVVKVEVYIDNQIPQGGVLLHPPYFYLWNLTSYPDSSVHTLYAKAYDADGNVSSTPVLNLIIFTFAPSNLSATVVSDTLIRLSWRDNSRRETGYQVERKLNDSSFVLVKVLGANTTSADIEGIYRVGDKISFQVRAVAGGEKSKYSNAVTVSPSFSAPQLSSVTLVSDTLARLTWIDNSSFEAAFEIELSKNGATFNKVLTVGANVTSATVIDTIYVGSAYSFRVRAKSTYNLSAYSNTSIVTVSFLAPDNLMALLVTDNQVVLQWRDNSTLEQVFQIEQAIGGGNFALVATVGQNITTAAVQGPFLRTLAYSFRVRAFSKYNSSGYSQGIRIFYSEDLYATGAFRFSNVQGQLLLAKWDGSVWAPSIKENANGIAYCSAVYNGEVYIGGSYTNLGRQVGNIVKWNGISWSGIGTGANGRVNCLYVFNNELYIGGEFTSINGVPAKYVAKWNGVSVSPVGKSNTPPIWSMVSYKGELYAGGDAGNQVDSLRYLFKLSATEWTRFARVPGAVLSLGVHNNELYVGGNFSNVSNTTANYIAKFNGSNWSPVGDQINGFVRSLTVFNNELCAGGDFSLGIGATVMVARWDGVRWSAVGGGINTAQVGSPIVWIVSNLDNQLFVGGHFSKAGPVSVNNIAKWNGSNWSNLGTGLTGEVHSICKFACWSFESVQ